MIPAGQQIELTIDGSTVFVVATVLHSANSVVVRFTNGVVSTLHQNPEGSLKRVIAFPDSKPTDLFVYPAATPIKVRPGGRIVDLIYARGESFGDVVGQVYGLTSFLAASDLTKQTGWDPARWSPPLGEARRVVTMAPSAYLQQPKTVSPIPNPDPVGQARQEAQLQTRRKAGIHPVRLESFGTVYHVEVGNPNETASEVSTLIYGSTGHTADVARAAGLQAPSPAGGGPATTFDPHLLGRAFDLTVDYIDESFVVSRHYDSNGQRATTLVDGAVLTEYPPAQSGPIVVVRYPTGYKRVVYRPPKLLITASQGLALFHTASDAALSPVEADTVARKFTADLLWAWSPGIPRASSDVADSLQLVDASEGPLLVALVAPPVPHTIVGTILDSLALRNPLVATLALVVAGYVAVLAVNLGRRTLERLQRARW
jgi:hypothetical protein